MKKALLATTALLATFGFAAPMTAFAKPASVVGVTKQIGDGFSTLGQINVGQLYSINVVNGTGVPLMIEVSGQSDVFVRDISVNGETTFTGLAVGGPSSLTINFLIERDLGGTTGTVSFENVVINNTNNTISFTVRPGDTAASSLVVTERGQVQLLGF